MSAWLLAILFLWNFIEIFFQSFCFFEHFLTKLTIWGSYCGSHWMFLMFIFFCFILKRIILIGETGLWKADIITQFFFKILIFNFNSFQFYNFVQLLINDFFETFNHHWLLTWLFVVVFVLLWSIFFDCLFIFNLKFSYFVFILS